MKTSLLSLVGVLGVLILAVSLSAHAAPPPVSYSRQILPLLQAQCLGCHGGPSPASGYSMETRDRLLSGGRHGAAVLPGKGAQSNLIRYMTGDLKPKMPPNGAVDLEKIALIRRWIEDGAKIDSMIAPASPSSGTKSSHRPRRPALRTAGAARRTRPREQSSSG